MANYPATSSTLSSAIQSGLSTQIRIQVPTSSGIVTVGAIKEIREEQRRPLARVGEVGTDGVIEIVPNKPTEFTLRITRTVFDGLSLTQAFGRGFRNIQAQRFPFSIDIVDVSQSNTEVSDLNAPGDDGQIVTSYINCWFESMSTPYRTDDYIIVQEASVWFETISTLRNGGSVNGSGLRALSYDKDSVEIDADTRRRLGAIDAAGILINTGYGGKPGTPTLLT